MVPQLKHYRLCKKNDLVRKLDSLLLSNFSLVRNEREREQSEKSSFPEILAEKIKRLRLLMLIKEDIRTKLRKRTKLSQNGNEGRTQNSFHTFF